MGKRGPATPFLLSSSFIVYPPLPHLRSLTAMEPEKSPLRCYYDYLGLISLSDNHAIMAHGTLWLCRRWLVRLSDRSRGDLASWEDENIYISPGLRYERTSVPCPRRISSKIGRVVSRNRLKINQRRMRFEQSNIIRSRMSATLNIEIEDFLEYCFWVSLFEISLALGKMPMSPPLLA